MRTAAIATLTAHNSPQQPSAQYVASLGQAPQYKENPADQTSQERGRSASASLTGNVERPTPSLSHL
ncbi:hypothetical protein KIN20_019099 [Parelaphostrongylus tenuis]|uniref:Uncharacterized protein n=1 Tax=Parelaphostrongylus tenuis TaxID=148309 RepID=A0AAD5N514_PARTN|nr:hypothetical protein KIN20_019099 [Parelaphostrongylus tenuis]